MLCVEHLVTSDAASAGRSTTRRTRRARLAHHLGGQPQASDLSLFFGGRTRARTWDPLIKSYRVVGCGAVEAIRVDAPPQESRRFSTIPPPSLSLRDSGSEQQSEHERQPPCFAQLCHGLFGDGSYVVAEAIVGAPRSMSNSLILLARPTRFERVTFAFGGHRSIPWRLTLLDLAADRFFLTADRSPIVRWTGLDCNCACREPRAFGSAHAVRWFVVERLERKRSE
jgi:hypothetical protein